MTDRITELEDMVKELRALLHAKTVEAEGLATEVDNLRRKLILKDKDIESLTWGFYSTRKSLEKEKARSEELMRKLESTELEKKRIEDSVQDMVDGALKTARDAMMKLGEVVICECGNVRNREYRFCFVCGSDKVLLG